MKKTDTRTLDVMDMTGREFGKYTIQSRLGEGGMAIVYKAVHREFESHVAIKFLLPEFAHREQVRRRFRDEARLQFKLRHPNLVRVIDTFEEEGAAGIVMDYIEGRSVSEELQQRGRPFSLQEIGAILLPVLDAIGYAHSHGVIHRDIKPSNILLETRKESFNPYVMDFGIAKSLEASGPHTKTGTFIGSIHYVSPEQISGKKTIDHRTDIYALGCTFYELFTGLPPFAKREEFQQILFGHLAEPPPSVAAFEPKHGGDLDRFFAKALAKDREERFPSCEVFARELRYLLDDRPPLPGSSSLRGPQEFPLEPQPLPAAPSADLAEPLLERAEPPPESSKPSLEMSVSAPDLHPKQGSLRSLISVALLLLGGGGGLWFVVFRPVGDQAPSSLRPSSKTKGSFKVAAPSPRLGRPKPSLVSEGSLASFDGGRAVEGDRAEGSPERGERRDEGPRTKWLATILSKPEAVVFQKGRKGSTPYVVEGTEGEVQHFRLEAAGYKSRRIEVVFSKPKATFLFRLESKLPAPLREKKPLPEPSSKKQPPKNRIFATDEDPL